MAKKFVLGKVTHNGKIFQNQDISVGDGEGDDIDARSAARLESMGFLVAPRSDEAKAAKAQQEEAERLAAAQAGLADDPTAGASTGVTDARGGGNQGDISTRGKGGR